MFVSAQIRSKLDFNRIFIAVKNFPRSSKILPWLNYTFVVSKDRDVVSLLAHPTKRGR